MQGFIKILKKSFISIYKILSFISLLIVLFYIIAIYFPIRHNEVFDHPITGVETKQFRTGIFLPHLEEGGILNTFLPVSYIVRDSNIQYDINASMNLYYKYRITWLNNTEYDMIFLESNSSSSNSKVGDKAKIKILSCGNNYYKAIVRSSHGDFNYTIYKINYAKELFAPNQVMR
jgi:hypothetical protein